MVGARVSHALLILQRDRGITRALTAAIAELAGLPGYPQAVIPHPVGSLTAEEVRERADAIAPRVVELLVRPS
jgi:hypothetical protein